jgi:DNA-binding transcriptional LysR family regulator
LAIFNTTRTIDLKVEDIDCAIRHGLGGWEKLTATLLFHETLLPIAHPEVAALSDASTIIRARSRFRDWDRWWRASGKFGDPPGRSVIVETRAQAMEAALAGVGIAVTDEAYAAPHLATGYLRAFDVAVPLPEGYYFVARDTQNPRTKAI